jgi:tetratricopeptide (TPR) repeat protein
MNPRDRDDDEPRPRRPIAPPPLASRLWWWLRWKLGATPVRLGSILIAPLSALVQFGHGAGRSRTTLGERLHEWYHRANVRRLLLGLPVALAVIATMIGAALAKQGARSDLVAHYARMGDEAFRAKDWNRARICFQRLVNQDPESGIFRYRLAVALARCGLRPQAAAVLEELSPEDRPGYGPAHLERAGELLAQAGERNSAAAVERALRHLDFALVADPKLAEAHALKARLLLQLNRVAQARPHLEPGAAVEPSLLIVLGRMLLGEGRQAEAGSALSSAVSTLGTRLAESPENDRLRLALADALSAAGRFEDAEEVIAVGVQRAVTESLAVALARLQLERFRRAQTDGRGAEPAVVALLRRGLDTLQRVDPRRADDELRMLQARLHAELGETEAAEKIVIQLAEKHPVHWLTLARFRVGRQPPGDPVEPARKALARLTERLKPDASTDSLRLTAIDAAILAEDFPAAERLLEVAPERSRTAPFQRARSNLKLAHHDAERRRGSADPAPALPRLLEAVRADESNPAPLERLSRMINAGGREAELARGLLAELAASGEAAASVHMLLGTEALIRKDSAVAVRHLEIAFRLRPDAPEIANNLAWALASGEKPELERALGVVDAALKARDLPSIRDTRGQILAKMGRWQEALAELQLALPSMRSNRNLHATLALVYRKLNLPAMAEIHERQSRVTPIVTPGPSPGK